MGLGDAFTELGTATAHNAQSDRSPQVQFRLIQDVRDKTHTGILQDLPEEDFTPVEHRGRHWMCWMPPLGFRDHLYTWFSLAIPVA